MSQPEQPKLVVDSDWKQEARAEKERLEKADAPRRPAPAEHAMPPADVQELIRMLASQALLYLGAIADPQTGRAILAPELAKYNIDLLGVLEEKTKGNLTPEELTLLQRSLYELRMSYAEVGRAIAKAVAEGKIGPAAAPPGAT
jgi:hypothetical protein